MQDTMQDARGPTAESRARRATAAILRAVGLAIGAAAAALYLYLLWQSPPDWRHAPMRQILSALIPLYVFFPLLIWAVPVWLADWIASHIDHRPDD